MKTHKLFTALCTLVALFLGLATVSAQGDAKLRTGDSFDLKIGGVPSDDAASISSNYTVDGEGCLNISLLGKIRVAGLTPSQIQAAVERAYVERGIFRHPTITLSIAAAARFVNVGGAVKAPGRIPYTPDMTVMTAINAAGDFNDYANQRKVRLSRGGSVSLVDCKKVRSDPSVDPKVLPGDSIQVPESIF